MSIQVVVVGARGKKLGGPVCQAILDSGGEFNLAVAVERPEVVEAGRFPGEFGNALFTESFQAARDAVNRCALSTPPEKHGGGAVFYATRADALLGRLQDAAACGFTIHVIGTTGLDPATLQAIKELSARHRIILTPNFSLGAWIGTENCAGLAVALPDAEVEIIETHHDQKEDSPSGTALLWARAVVAAREQEFEKVVIFGRPRGKMKRTRKQVCVHSVRGGNVPGNHRAIFFGQHDEILVEHNVRSGAVFAEGALKAFRWAAQDDTPGLYGMPDVLGLDLLKRLGVS